jgi:hypothetical protein
LPPPPSRHFAAFATQAYALDFRMSHAAMPLTLMRRAAEAMSRYGAHAQSLQAFTLDHAVTSAAFFFTPLLARLSAMLISASFHADTAARFAFAELFTLA